MPEGNIERLRNAYVALNAGEVEAALRFAAEDFVIHRAGPDPPVRGKEAVKAFVAPDAFAEQTFEPLELRANGDVVFAWLLVRVKGAASGIMWEQHVAHVWQFRDGLATSLTVTFEREDALQATGLSE